jgi:predicted RNA-binding protein (virulence factor B family)
VELLIYDQTELGYKAIINNSSRGVLYKNEVFQTLKKGQHITGYIKKVRDDGKIDLCLQKPGYENIDGVSEKIMDKLKAKGGFIPVTDKSSSAAYTLLKAKITKGTGTLQETGFTIESNGITLIKKR